MQSAPPTCLIDFETRSFLDVTEVGAWRYAEDPTTEILCMAYKLGNGPTKLWVPDIMPFPQEIIDHVEAGGFFEAHNVQFERAIWLFILKNRLGIPMPKRWKDTLAACAMRGIPLKLDAAGDALKLPIKKDKRGKYLLQTLSVPKWGTKKEPNRIYREDWDLTQELYDYCMTDIDSEDCLGKTIGELPPAEYGLWVLDQKINQRGVKIDLEAVEAALEIIQEVETRLNTELYEITDKAVERSSQRDRIMKWLLANDLTIPDLTKGTLEDLLTKDEEGEYPQLWGYDPKIIRVLEIRSQLAKASTKKLERMRQTVSGDGRIRGLLQYHGASTGRWAGRLAQPHNLPRPFLKDPNNNKKSAKMEELIALIKRKDIEALDYLYGNAMDAVAHSVRGMFIAEEGYELYICDFSAIEARVTFWVAGCHIGLEVFHKSDRGESEDIYCVTASDLVGFKVKKKDNPHERQLGKITILGCGYQMGWSKLQFQAQKDYNVSLRDDEAQRMVNLYRAKYEEVPSTWYGLQEAAISTVKTGEPHSYLRIIYDLVHDDAGTWLTCILPNGRRLWYYDPVVEKQATPWGKRDTLSYMGRDNKLGGSWGRIYTYGGMLMENVVQAIARDLMAEAMIRVEQAGFKIILTVHDEVIAEVPKGADRQKEFEKLMAETPPWAMDCPVAVEGGVVTIYQKV
jgi:DNA polymerase bacteriophage-type